MPKPAARTTLCLILTFFLTSLAAAAQYRWSDVERVVAISDPHGAYDAMRATLRNAGVIDAAGNWSGDATHLVITGDLLDRGDDSRKIMDLVMQLESQAPQAGGMVHLTLGNHEVMNIVGDLRYVTHGEYAAFAAEESAAERERWFDIFRSVRAAQTEGGADVAELRVEFDRDRPPGFYAHRRAFGSQGKYGKWLLQKPLMVVINDTAYVHGGLPELVAELGLERLNRELLAQVTDYVAALEVLQEAGLIDPRVNFYEQGKIAEGIRTDATIPAEFLAALDTVVELNEAAVHDSIGPLWYRGTVGCSVPMEGDVLAAALDAIAASRVVIGHTPTVTRRVLSRFDGRVIEIDTGMLSSAYQGSGNALILEGTRAAVINEAGPERGKPVPHPRRVGARTDELSAEALAELLARGEIVSTTSDETGRTTVEVNRDGSSVSALFVESPRRKGLNPELAAYRLDELLGLEMVPVTVLREIDGRRGTLQFLPKNSRDEAYRASTGQGSGAWCPLPRQWNSMYIFDVLLYNEGRASTSMVYSPENWQLLLMTHSNAFGTKRDRPKYLAEVPLELTGTWLEALASLTDDRLKTELGDVLDKRRITALGKRRDLLLSLAE